MSKHAIWWKPYCTAFLVHKKKEDSRFKEANLFLGTKLPTDQKKNHNFVLESRFFFSRENSNNTIFIGENCGNCQDKTELEV